MPASSPWRAEDAPTELLSGYVEKQSRMGVWHKRYFQLLNGDVYLHYYPDDKKDRGPDGMKGGHIDLRLCALVLVAGKVVTLHLHDKTKYRLRFGQNSEAAHWKNELYHVVKGLHVYRPTHAASPRPSPAGSVSNTPTSGKRPDSAQKNQNSFSPMQAPKDVSDSESAYSDSEPSEPSEPEPTDPAGLLLLRVWCGCSLFALFCSLLAVAPVPTLDLWFFKIFVLSGVLHATVLTLVTLLAVTTGAGLLIAAFSSPKSPPRTKGVGTRRRLGLAALVAYVACAALLALPALVAVPLAVQLPADLTSFLAAAGLAQPDTLAEMPPPLDLATYMVDPPCALANVWEYYQHTKEIVYKPVPSSVGTQGQPPIEDWSGFGGLTNESRSTAGLRLAIFGVDDGLKKGAEQSLKPVLISLPGGGWYRGSLYDGLQCYLPAALEEGWAVVAAEYRSGSAGWHGRDMVEDALDLLTWVLKEGPRKGLNPRKVVVMGGSAGAHIGLLASLVANNAAKDKVVKGVVARYGAIGNLTAAYAEHASRVPRGLGELLSTLQPGGSSTRVRGWDEKAALEHIAGGGKSLEAELEYLSPTTHVGPWAPPTVVLHSTQDEFYSSRHVADFTSAMHQAKRPLLTIEPRLHSHGCDIGSTAPFQLTKYALVGLLRAVNAGNE